MPPTTAPPPARAPTRTPVRSTSACAAPGFPLLAVFGAEEQIYDPEESLAAYAAIGAETELVTRAGHSPNVERPALTAALVTDFTADERQTAEEKGPAHANEKGRPGGRPK